jgi:sucrose-6-phosphate hydrolase SacC (GH32 family)
MSLFRVASALTGRLQAPRVVAGAAALWLCAWLAGAPVLLADDFPAELVRFEPYLNNPVFSAAGPGTWEVKIRERGWILHDNRGWHMWYTGYDGTREGIKRLGYATSRDGLAWTRHALNPLLPELWVEDMMVVRDGPCWFMFAEGANDEAHWLSSSDGVAWHSRGKLDVRDTNGRPLSKGPLGTPTVFRDSAGNWWLFFEREDAGVWLAKSVDFKVWVKVREEAVLLPGPAEYDRLKVALNQVIECGGKYYAYYHGTGTPERPQIWTTNVAVSEDLVHWRKYQGNPLLPAASNKSSGIIVHDGARFRLYTMHDRVDAHFARDVAVER